MTTGDVVFWPVQRADGTWFVTQGRVIASGADGVVAYVHDVYGTDQFILQGKLHMVRESAQSEADIKNRVKKPRTAVQVAMTMPEQAPIYADCDHAYTRPVNGGWRCERCGLVEVMT